MDFVPRVEGQSGLEIVPHPGGHPGDEVNNSADISQIFSIPWGHHKLIIDKCGKLLFCCME